MSDPFASTDLAQWERLAKKAVDGDARAWQQLAAELWPVLTALVTDSRSMGSRGRSEDQTRDVLTHLLEKLGAQNGRGLRLYFAWRERHPGKTFADWLRIATKNAVRDHLRERLGRRTASDEPSPKRLLNEFASSPLLDTLGVRPPITAAQTARQLLEFAKRHLPEDQQRALMQWLQGSGGDEASHKLVRAAVATLRRQFATGT